MPPFDEKHLMSPAPAAAVSASSSTENLPRSPAPPAISHTDENGDDFDPCQNAKPCSPFYNHDTPRASVDQAKSSPTLHVDVRDLEGQSALTPAQTSESRPAGDAGTLRQWASSRTNIFGRNKKAPKSEQMTQPRNRSCSCMSSLSKRQRLMVKILIALVIVGAMVGIGVGISLRVGGEVYKDSSTTSKIGDV